MIWANTAIMTEIRVIMTNQTDNYAQTHYQLHWLQTLNSHLNMNMTTHLTRGRVFTKSINRIVNMLSMV